MKKLTVLEKRLKRAHEYRQNTLKQQRIYTVSPFRAEAIGQYTPERLEEKPGGTEKLKADLIVWLAGIRHSLQNIRWKPIRIKRVMFALALIVIILIILSSKF